MDDNLLEEEVALLQLTPEVLAALSRSLEDSSTSSSLNSLAEHVLYGDAICRQQVDIVRLQRELDEAPLEASCKRDSSLAVPFLRRLHWARLLRLLSGETLEGWALQVKEQRDRYRSLRQQQQLTASQLATLDPQRFHPLAATAGNPWSQRQADEELQEEIWRDIERTYPERQLFNREGTRRSLQRVLFTWAKGNPDVSYKQGMNEILAVLYLACAREAVPSPPADAPLSPFSIIFSADPADLEADAFCLFDGLMTGCCMRYMYLPPQKEPPAAPLKGSHIGHLLGSPQPPRAPATSAVLHRCNMVFDDALCKSDRDVYLHLNELGVEPQLFLLRWLRLLFSREFHIEDTLLIWDALLADAWLATEPNVPAGGARGAAEATGAGSALATAPAPSAAATATATPGTAGTVGACTPEECASAAAKKLPLVDYFAIAMLKFIRQQLLESDYSNCLRRLLKYPPIESVQCLVALSLAVRKGTTLSTASAAATPNSTNRRRDNSSNGINNHSSMDRSNSRTANASPAVQGPIRSPPGHPRFIQQPPPLTPTIVSNPQLQHDETSNQQDWHKESAFTRGTATAAAFDTPGEASTAGLLGSHIDAMRQALTSVAEGCNDVLGNYVGSYLYG